MVLEFRKPQDFLCSRSPTVHAVHISPEVPTCREGRDNLTVLTRLVLTVRRDPGSRGTLSVPEVLLDPVFRDNPMAPKFLEDPMGLNLSVRSYPRVRSVLKVHRFPSFLTVPMVLGVRKVPNPLVRRVLGFHWPRTLHKDPENLVLPSFLVIHGVLIPQEVLSVRTDLRVQDTREVHDNQKDLGFLFHPNIPVSPVVQGSHSVPKFRRVLSVQRNHFIPEDRTPQTVQGIPGSPFDPFFHMVLRDHKVPKSLDSLSVLRVP